MRKTLIILSLLSLASQTLSQTSSAVKSSFADTDSPLMDIIWCGENKPSASIIVLTEKGTVYRSVNKGSTWLNMKPYFKTSAKPELEKGDKVELDIMEDWYNQADNKISG